MSDSKKRIKAVELAEHSTRLRGKIKKMATKQKTIDDELRMLIQEVGDQDSNGSFHIQANAELVVVMQKRTSFDLDEDEAGRLLSQHPDLFEICASVVYKVDTAKVKKAMQDPVKRRILKKVITEDISYNHDAIAAAVKRGAIQMNDVSKLMRERASNFALIFKQTKTEESEDGDDEFMG